MTRLLISMLLVFSVPLAAQELHMFSNGEVADADKINENFEVLSQQVATLYDPVEARYNQWQQVEIDVDCNADSFAFEKAYKESLNKNRLVFRLNGQCLFNDSLRVAGRFISISGAVDEEATGTCVAPKPKLITRYGEENARTDIFVNNMGALRLNCLSLGTNERGDGVGVVSGYANSLIRMDREVQATENGSLDVVLRNGSLFRYLGYQAGQGFEGRIFSNMGRVELLGENHQIDYLSLKASSIFNCYGCGGAIYGGELLGNSSLHARSVFGNFSVSNIGLEHGSSLFTEDSGEFAVDITNANYLEPTDRGRQIYTAQNMEVETIGSAVEVNPPEEEACGADSQIQFIKEVSESYYYWYDELAQVDAANYSDASAYLSAIMQPIWTDGTGRDPGFSYLTTIEQDTQRFTAGTFYGYGVRYRIINNNFYFADSYEGSPAYTAGIRRGQRLLAVKLDGQADFETWEELVARNAALPGAVFGASGELQTTVFRVEYEGEESEISVTTAETTTPPLAGEALVIERDNDSPVGYINFRTFIDAADGPLRAAATEFRDAGVTDLIIDLRYNGGGLVRVAETFLNLLAGDTANGQLSYIINLNDNHQDQNITANFASLPETFSPLRIAFITTAGSASASELLINGLDSHIELAIVGSETSGKAVGQFAFDLDPDACETRLRLIAFEIQNGEGQGGYFTGLVNTGRFTFFEAADDATRPFADPEEDSFAVALGWLNGTTSKADQMKRSALPLMEDIGVAPFDASWPVFENAPLNPDGSVRSF